MSVHEPLQSINVTRRELVRSGRSLLADAIAVADHLEISDQVANERLRRGIETLVSNTLIALQKQEAEYKPTEN